MKISEIKIVNCHISNVYSKFLILLILLEEIFVSLKKPTNFPDLVPEAVDGGVPLVADRPPLPRGRLHEERRRVLPVKVDVHPRVKHGLI